MVEARGPVRDQESGSRCQTRFAVSLFPLALPPLVLGDDMDRKFEVGADYKM